VERNAWSVIINETKARKWLSHQRRRKIFQTLNLLTYQVVVPRTTRNPPRQRVTTSHNSKYTKQEPTALIENHYDTTNVNICALLET
jgi:hypothetical protein